MNLPIIHIGLPRAGSTTLQELFFSKNPSVYHVSGSNKNIDTASLELRKKAKEIMVSLRNDSESVFRRKVPVFRNYVDAMFEEAQNLNRRIVFSNESLSLNGTLKEISRKEIACRLYSIIGKAKILLVLREPVQWFKSNYLHAITGLYRAGLIEEAKKLSYGEFFRRISQVPREYVKESSFGIEAINSKGIIQDYGCFFGMENIHISVFEEQVKNPKKVYRLLENLLDIKIGEQDYFMDKPPKKTNMTVKEMNFWISLARICPDKIWPSNRIRKRYILPLLRKSFYSRRKWPAVPKEIVEKIKEICSENNKWIEQTYDQALSEYGYFL